LGGGRLRHPEFDLQSHRPRRLSVLSPDGKGDHQGVAEHLTKYEIVRRELADLGHQPVGDVERGLHRGGPTVMFRQCSTVATHPSRRRTFTNPGWAACSGVNLTTAADLATFPGKGMVEISRVVAVDQNAATTRQLVGSGMGKSPDAESGLSVVLDVHQDLSPAVRVNHAELVDQGVHGSSAGDQGEFLDQGDVA
jgi:hypothetical protein